MDEKLELARGDLRRGDIYGADRQVKQILELDPKNDGALELQGNIRLVQSRNVIAYPQLRTKLDRPVTLEFRDANLKTIFEVLSQVAGLNFIFDKDLRPDMKPQSSCVTCVSKMLWRCFCNKISCIRKWSTKTPC